MNYYAFKSLYENIKSNYPETLAWIKHKASWEHITLFAVLTGYKKHIEVLMEQEDANHENP